MNEVTVIRRINLGNYEHYEIVITINDENENNAMYRALILMVQTFNALGKTDGIDLSKIERKSFG